MNINFKLTICFLILFLSLFSLSTVSAYGVDDYNIDINNIVENNSYNNYIESVDNINIVSVDLYNFKDSNSNINSLDSNLDSKIYNLSSNSQLNSNCIYVGKNITENGKGTLEDPFNNLKLALNNVKTNDIINIFSGTYYGYDNTALTISTDNLTIKSYGGSVIFDGCNSNQIFDVVGNNVNIYDITFIRGLSSYGGAIYWAGHHGAISNCTFLSNKAIGIANAIYWFGNYGFVNNCTFEDNKGADRAGAIGWSGNYGYVNNSIFISNYADSYGGAIYVYNDNLVINNSKFINNTVQTGSGAVEIRGVNYILNNSLFISNLAIYTAGALGLYGVNGTVSNCNFSYNKANNGSAIYIGFNDDIINLNNISFFNNKAKSYSLAIDLDNDFINVKLECGNNLLNGIYSLNNQVYLDGNLMPLNYSGYNQTIFAYSYDDKGNIILSKSKLTNDFGNLNFSLDELSYGSKILFYTSNNDCYTTISNLTNISYNVSMILPNSVSGKLSSEVNIPVIIQYNNHIFNMDGKLLNISINDYNLGEVVINNGSFNFKVPNIIENPFKITVKYNDDKIYSNCSNSTLFIIKSDLIVDMPSNLSISPGQSLIIPIIFKDEDSNLINISNLTVIYPNGNRDTLFVLDNQIIINIPGDEFKGKWTFLIGETETTLNKSVNLNLDVIKWNLSIKVSNVICKYNSKSKFLISVESEDGTLFNGILKVKLPNESLVIVKIIDGKGVFYWNIPKTFLGKYKVYIIFNGDNYYNSIFSSFDIFINSNNNSKDNNSNNVRKEYINSGNSMEDTGLPLLNLLSAFSLIAIAFLGRKF